jgi:hypothetical protein
MRKGNGMSTARAVTRPEPKPRRQPARQPILRLIPGGTARSPKAPFVALVVTVLAVGLLGLLVLNTALREGAIALSELESDTARLRDQVTVLQDDAAAREAPGELARRADQLGMVPVDDPIFLDVPAGVVSGAGSGG